MSILSNVKRRVPYRIKDAIRPPIPALARNHVRWTFSQTGEDLLIGYIFEQLGVTRPSYLDIGAYRPFHINNTALFYLAGSRGINVDPDPDAIAAFRTHRPEDLNLNLGCAGEPGLLTFYRLTAPSLNTFSLQVAQEVERESNGRIKIESTTEVPVDTVPSLLQAHGRTTPELLTLDVEGFDLAVLRTLPSWPGLPVVICVETISYSETGHGNKDPGFGELLHDLGYLSLADTHHNTIYVQRSRWFR